MAGSKGRGATSFCRTRGARVCPGVCTGRQAHTWGRDIRAHCTPRNDGDGVWLGCKGSWVGLRPDERGGFERQRTRWLGLATKLPKQSPGCPPGAHTGLSLRLAFACAVPLPGVPLLSLLTFRTHPSLNMMWIRVTFQRQHRQGSHHIELGVERGEGEEDVNLGQMCLVAEGLGAVAGANGGQLGRGHVCDSRDASLPLQQAEFPVSNSHGRQLESPGKDKVRTQAGEWWLGSPLHCWWREQDQRGRLRPCGDLGAGETSRKWAWARLPLPWQLEPAHMNVGFLCCSRRDPKPQD